jgi:hypothetical protein
MIPVVTYSIFGKRTILTLFRDGINQLYETTGKFSLVLVHAGLLWIIRYGSSRLLLFDIRFLQLE